MHVLQRIAIEAEDKDEAFRSVKGNLEDMLERGGEWFDWFITGGGRWNPNEGSQYNSDDQSMTISYAEEPEKFIQAVNEGIELRLEEFKRYRQQLAEKNLDINASLDKYDGQVDFSFELYELSKCIDMLQGKWDFNSYFLDLENESTNTKYMLDSIDRGNKNWYIVFVDFHF